jgi:hypothetical protein
MFRRAGPNSLTLSFDGDPVRACDGDSVASALWAAGAREAWCQ